MDPSENLARAPTGIAGLDEVLAGGLLSGRLFLIEGMPGTGKTTFALQFLRAGVAAGERALYITLSETVEELRQGALSHGWSLDGVDLHELAPAEALLDAERRQSLLHAADLELGEAVAGICAIVDRVRPARIVLDSLSELRLLAQGSLRYRRQVLALRHFFARHGATVLLLDDMTAEAGDRTVHSIAHGVVRLEELAPEYGAERRRLRVLKYRGTAFRGGFHDFVIRTGGVTVFPRLISADHPLPRARDTLTTGVAGLDALLGGGIERGTNTLLIGPSGIGKSVLALLVALRAVAQGGRALLLIFDEDVELLRERSERLGLDLAGPLAADRLRCVGVDAAQVSPGELTHRVMDAVAEGFNAIVLDSLNGYYAALPGESFLVLHLHELLQFLNRQGVYTVLTVAQHGLLGEVQAPFELTYIADTVVLMRYFEAFGRVRRAMSVLKKRSGAHETTVRELVIAPPHGIAVGEPLANFLGVLTGIPRLPPEGTPGAG